ncbi:site-specific DNA-methyltransferase [Rhodosalinus halophilus]|uniref:site-specific DNA-methyltransferase (adenine-specific) n=1 Tax=Rhodosalinus halophilus TaxID=2259333 RepID=A0A365U477_9RHOB|nr:DNA methyltransferase [Rhodosalinus halophilus]RBI82841.1 site-specific DNA-methyltransferase [Rhodosalinus halophilus]
MSRLTDLIARAKAKDRALGDELEREFKALASRRAFGLNFERHRPESVELPGRPIRRGDKVRILPPRGSTAKGDARLWKVLRIDEADGKRTAHVSLIDAAEPETADVATDDIVVVAEFRDYIYPGLVSTGKVERGADKPYHTVINGENFHVLEALTFTHRGKIDAIYIDPPYNTGARDWKYNNDYVEEEDLYRHSKWLAFMERRLLVAKRLLNPDASCLIVSIDEKEYLRLGMLLEQMFPEASMQMISSVINPKGTGRFNEFSRTNEYIYMLWFGDERVKPLKVTAAGKAPKVEWQTFRRRDLSSVRHTRPGQFYPIYVNEESGEIDHIGEPLPHHVPRDEAPKRKGCIAVFPVRPDGTEMNWAITVPALKNRLAKGYARAGKFTGEAQPYIIQYLKSGPIKDIEEGRATIVGRNPDGSVIAEYQQGTRKLPTTQWEFTSHSAEHYGTNLLKRLLPDRRFPFPKSMYAVEDCLRFFIEDKPHAIVLDFFSGSGTTAHAVMRLNRQDGGRRQCISVTNNEVAADEQAALRMSGLRPGDPDWEKWGICDYITKPRIRAAITGKTPEGEDIDGDYKFTDEFPMAEGFEENAEFFTLTYETPVAVHHNLAFQRIAPLLWMRAGAEGPRIDALPDQGWAVAETYGLLVDLDRSAEFCDAVDACERLRIAYIVTDDDRRFQSVARRLPDSVEPIRLYESYLSNFRFSMGR